MSTAVTMRPMTDLERERALALGRCSFPTASFSKRFARDLAGQARGHGMISEKQSARLEIQCWIYRRQLPGALVPETQPAGYMTPRQRAQAARLAAYMQQHLSPAGPAPEAMPGEQATR